MEFKALVEGYLKNPWRYLLWVVLGAGVLLNGSRFFMTEFRWDSGRDFKIIYVGIRAYQQGHNPYDKFQMINTWKSIASEAGIPFVVDPEMEKGLQYPPITLFLLYPISYLPYKWCMISWYSVITVGIGVFLWMGGKLFLPGFSSRAFFLLLLVALAFKGTIYTWILGQPLYLSAALGIVGLWLQSKGKWLLSALFVGLSIVKVTIFLPFFVYYVVQGKFKAFLYGSAIAGVLVLGSYGFMPNQEFYTQYLLRVSESQYMIFDLTRSDLFIGITTDFAAVLMGFSPNLVSWKYLFIASFAGILGLAIFKNRPSRIWTFLSIFLLFYMAMYHGYYDLFMVVPLITVFAIYNDIRPYHVFTSIYCCIPVNGLLKEFPIDQSVILITNMAWMTFLYFVFLRVYISDFGAIKDPN